MGDAPDGGATGYTGGSAKGKFPSKVASSGPRHGALSSLILGSKADGEPDSAQVDKDPFDDGAAATLFACSAKSELDVVLKGTGLTAAQRSAGNIIYVNAWFDWNRDGDWDDGTDGCAPEWAIENLPVPAESLTSGTRLFPITFKAGKQVRELWWRVTVTLNEPAIDPGGRGRATPYIRGETEDYFQRAGKTPTFEDESGKSKKKKKKKKKRKKKKKDKSFTVSCVGNPAVIAHGGTAKVRFIVASKAKGDVFGAFASPRKGKGFGVSLNPSPNQRGVPPGYKRMSGFTFKSKEVDPPLRIQVFSVRFVFSRDGVVRNLTCRVVVVHFGQGEGKGKKKQEPKIPKVRCEGRCGGVIPPLPGPVSGTTSRFEPIPIEIVQLHLTGTPPVPVGGFQIPLGPPNPVPRDAPQLRNSNAGAGCGVTALQGGPPVLDCRFTPAGQLVDSFFDIFYTVDIGNGPLRGLLLDGAGNSIGSFEAPRAGATPTPVSGQAQLTQILGPQVNFNASFNSQLEQFLLFFPGFQVQAGGAPGFICQPMNFQSQPNAALVCNGSVQPGALIQGGLQLNPAPPPTVHQTTQLFGAAGGQLFGPFPVSGP
jgi:hypothetical protein